MTTCRICGDPVERATATLESRGDGAGVLAERAPVWRCPRGHRTVVARADLRSAVMDLLPTARRRLRGERCVECGSPLTMPDRWTTRVLTVVLPPVVSVTVEAPLTRCPSCAVEQARPAVAQQVGRALDGAFADS